MFEKKVLDHGFVRVVDTMGDDVAIVDAARKSYGDGTKATSDTRHLIRYMMRHGHTSPFEQAEIKFHVKLPIFVARQWMRHRMASYNEVSGRYSVMKDEFYVADFSRLTKQSTINKQGSSNEVIEDADVWYEMFVDMPKICYQNYKSACDADINRETSRTLLPLSTYTEFYFKIDLHNLFHFLKLRLDKHAQYEIRVYAEAIAEFVKLWVPHAWGAFVDYRLEAVTLSSMEVEGLKSLICVGIFKPEGRTYTDDLELKDCLMAQRQFRYDEDEGYGDFGKFITQKEMMELGMSKREVTEFLEKWK